jgi:hypothetical protein
MAMETQQDRVNHEREGQDTARREAPNANTHAPTSAPPASPEEIRRIFPSYLAPHERSADTRG